MVEPCRVMWSCGMYCTPCQLFPWNVAQDYDNEGDYIKKWIPQLASVPQQHIHEPWKMSQEAAHQVLTAD